MTSHRASFPPPITSRQADFPPLTTSRFPPLMTSRFMSLVTSIQKSFSPLMTSRFLPLVTSQQKNTNDVMFPASENATTNRLRAVASSFHVANPRNLNIFRSFRRSEVVGGSVENIPNRTNRLLQSLRMRHKT